MDSLNFKIAKFLVKIKAFFGNNKVLLFFVSQLDKIKKQKVNKIASLQTELDKKLVYSLSKKKIPSLRQIKYIDKVLNKKERVLMKASLLILSISILVGGLNFYFTHLELKPIKGGDYSEGVIGHPKYVNPLYSGYSDVDGDLTSLIFSSLFKRDQNGGLINDLIESYEIGGDNKIYTFKIKQGVKWHDGSDLKADDVVFTFNAIKDSRYNSPLRASFLGVEIDKIDDNTIRFVLVEPYAAFLNLLTFGIMPENLWYHISPASAALADLNIRPVGSGPYKFKSFTKDKGGNIKAYTLVRNENYHGQAPYINSLIFKSFASFEEIAAALNNNSIQGVSYLPKRFEKDLVAPDSLNLYKINLPQLTAVFFNKEKNKALADKKVRQALAMAIDKGVIVKDILKEDAKVIDGPILPDNFAYNPDNKKYKFDQEASRNLLNEAKWEEAEITEEMITQAEEDASSEDEKAQKQAAERLSVGVGKWRQKEGQFLIINLTTVESEENLQVAKTIKDYWEGVGVKTQIEIIPANKMQIDILRPRNYQALFYGQVVGADPDSYAFWHSSQIKDVGLNIANYSNKEVDALLEDARVTSDNEQRKEKYKKFQEIITEDLPAIFLYSPVYTYIQDKKIKNFNIKNILVPHDRLNNISDWYIKTDKKIVW